MTPIIAYHSTITSSIDITSAIIAITVISIVMICAMSVRISIVMISTLLALCYH